MDFADKNNIFYKILQGDAPCYKVYEDDDFLVILDIFPISLGHCLIIPKLPAVDIFDLKPDSSKKIYPLAQKIAVAVKAATACDAIKIIQNNGSAAGQIVFYFHMHVVPYFENDSQPKTKPTAEEFEGMAARLSEYLIQK